MKRRESADLMTMAFLVVVFLAVFGGWVANVVKLAGADFSVITGMLVLRVIGIFAAPLGAVLGYF